MSNKERQARFRAKKLEQECPEVREHFDRVTTPIIEIAAIL